MLRVILITMASVTGGAVIGGATIVGLVNAQTAPPDQSPASVSNPTLDYGSTQ
ncbi:hypothetical protein [Nocardioides sp.]|uniref:hypothetical protein n=1 Tax=Nocardioides sp. TaxID=35761 RepID=UPI003783110C